MSKISLSPSASGTGNFTIASPATNTDRTLTLPDSTGTVVVTSGAQTIEFADGSASAPSITNSGDTNTGMFFPAADTIAFAEGGTESMRIDSSGNVLVGGTVQISNEKLLVLGNAASSVNARIRNDSTSSSAGAAIALNASGNAWGIECGSSAKNSNALTWLIDYGGTNGERLRLNTDGTFQFNSGYGSVVTAYGCRAWVNFNGTGTVAIRGSGNVSSITDNGVGDYTVNFTTAMVDVNYAVTGMSRNTSNSGYLIYGNSISGNATGSVRISVSDVNVFADSNTVSVSIFR